MRARVIVGLILSALVTLLGIHMFQRRLVSGPTNTPAATEKFWRTVKWEQNDRPKLFQVDALGQVRETKDTSLRLCLPVGSTVIRVRACNEANSCSEWTTQTADVGTDGERCE